jgi:iron complex transport system substrate-binding protein
MHHDHHPLLLICLGYVLVATGISLALTSFTVNADGKPTAGPPSRIVSMNLCTDQLALLVAAPEQIHSLSYISRDPAASPLAEEARRYPPSHGLAEEIFLMRPDLVLAGAYTRRETTNMLTRLGFRVETFAPATSFDDIRTNIRRMGRLLDRAKRASHLLTAFDRARSRRRAATQADPRDPRPLAALYYANSHTSGRGTLASDILAHARLENLATSLGLGGIVRLPLELIVFNAPDLLITGDAGHHPTARAGAALQHPALRANRSQIVAMDNRWSCGTPAVLDIVRELEDVVMEKTRPERPATSSKG